MIVGPDGVAERRLAEPGWHDESLTNPTQFQDFVRDRNDISSDDVVFISPLGMTYCYDRNDRRDKATCAMTKTDAWSWLMAADQPTGGPKLGQVDFIRLLRITLRGCLPDPSLLQLARKLKFNADGVASGDVQHGRDQPMRVAACAGR